MERELELAFARRPDKLVRRPSSYHHSPLSRSISNACETQLAKGSRRQIRFGHSRWTVAGVTCRSSLNRSDSTFVRTVQAAYWGCPHGLQIFAFDLDVLHAQAYRRRNTVPAVPPCGNVPLQCSPVFLSHHFCATRWDDPTDSLFMSILPLDSGTGRSVLKSPCPSMSIPMQSAAIASRRRHTRLKDRTRRIKSARRDRAFPSTFR